MDRFNELDIVIRHKAGKVVAGIPQLRLYAKANSVDLALAALEEKRVAFVAALEEAGELDAVEIHEAPIVPTRGAVRPSGDLRVFAAKVGSVVFFLVAGVVISSLLVVSKVETAIEKTVGQVKNIKVGGAQFWSNVEASIDRMASPAGDLPEEKKKKLLSDIHVIAARWRPFVGEIQAALADPNQPWTVEMAPK